MVNAIYPGLQQGNHLFTNPLAIIPQALLLPLLRRPGRYKSPGVYMTTPRPIPSPMDASPKTVPAIVSEKQVSTDEISLPSLDPEQQAIQGWTDRHIHKWKSPFLMVLFYFLGLSMSIAHCIFYPKLSGDIVGGSESQEEKIRFGTAFSFISQICLSASVWTAYTQWLWRTIQRTEMTVAALNAAFGADTSALSLLNVEMLQKLRVGSIMACFAWSLLLPPFFTPATLFVYPSSNIEQVVAAMPYPSIARPEEIARYAYSPPRRRGKKLDERSRSFTGPRTQLNLIAAATSSLGEILTIDLPYNNSAYAIQFFAPIIKCEAANAIDAERINDFLEQEMAKPMDNKTETDSTYYGFVPTFDSSGNLTAVSRPRLQTPSKPMNELWMTFLRPRINEAGQRVKDRHFQVCKPHNASYDLEISQYRGIQNVTGNYTVGEAIDFPNDGPNDVSNLTQHSYTAFMWVMCDQLVGRFAWYDDPGTDFNGSQIADQFGIIDSPIQRTSLLGSLDLDAFFELDEEKKLYQDRDPDDIWDLSDQRLQDKMLARNRTLDALIEELSFNVTVSLMHNSLLTHKMNTTIRLTKDVNRYAYKAFGLFIPYALANLFAFICILIGMYSYILDGVHPDKQMQDIISAAKDPNVVHLVRSRKRSITIAIVDGELVWSPAPHEGQNGVMEMIETFWTSLVARRRK